MSASRRSVEGKFCIDNETSHQGEVDRLQILRTTAGINFSPYGGPRVRSTRKITAPKELVDERNKRRTSCRSTRWGIC